MFRRRASPDRSAQGERKPPDLRQLQRLYAYTRPYRPQLVVGVLSVSVASVLGFAFPALAGRLFNTAFGSGSFAF